MGRAHRSCDAGWAALKWKVLRNSQQSFLQQLSNGELAVSSLKCFVSVWTSMSRWREQKHQQSQRSCFNRGSLKLDMFQISPPLTRENKGCRRSDNITQQRFWDIFYLFFKSFLETNLFSTSMDGTCCSISAETEFKNDFLGCSKTDKQFEKCLRHLKSVFAPIWCQIIYSLETWSCYFPAAQYYIKQ